MTKEVEIYYGLMFGPIEEQLNEQGFTLGFNKAESCEKVRKAIYCLIFNCIVTDSQADLMFAKLNKKVIKNIKPIKKCVGKLIEE